MNFINIFSRLTLALLSALMIASGSLLEGNPVLVPLGPPTVISPGPALPDPILQDLTTVMSDFYQQPWYPGALPYPANYLGDIHYLSNFYIGSGLVCSPCDNNIMHFSIGQNYLIDLTDTFDYIIGSNTFATSTDGGVTWNYGPPIEQILPLGGTISQLINASLGPGLAYTYAKNGRLYAHGNGYFDMHPNFSNPLPMSGFLFTASEDNGATWPTPHTIYSSDYDWFFVDIFSNGTGLREFYVSPDPANSNLLHASTQFMTPYIDPRSPDSAYHHFGQIYYSRSEDGGKTFSPFEVAYNIFDDPVWQAKNFDPDYYIDPNYFKYGGFTLNTGPPFVIDKNIVLIPVQRWYPKRGSPTFAGASNIIFEAMVARSEDGGKTWNKVAGISEPCIIVTLTYDPGFPMPIGSNETISGYSCSPFFGDGSLGASRSQGFSPLLSSLTGRVYMTFPGYTFDESKPFTAAYTDVRLTVSSDKGATWSPNVTVNRTPYSQYVGGQQAISSSSVITSNGYLVVAYYDFRNWTGFPGEVYNNIPLADIPPLPMDCWLAVYKEVEDPHGGSTGVGLDFVEEIRLTPQSFNARIDQTETAIPYIANYLTGTPEGIPMMVNKNNELFVVYSMQSSGSPSNLSTGIQGINIDTNGYQTLYLQRFKFANPSNQ